MRTVDGFTLRERSVFPARRWLAALVFGLLSLGSVQAVQAQSAPAKGNAPDTSSAATGFSIETEMLTYRALASNSAAIACDIAAYLNGSSASFTSPSAGSLCDVKTGTTKTTVVILPFDRSELADFQIWRADMARMRELHDRARIHRCPPAEGDRGRGGSAPASLAGVTAVGQSLAIAQTVLAMMSSEESTSPVGGTIQDQAFMDGVGRELRTLSVAVLMPAAYTPFSLAAIDEKSSPFMVGLYKLLDARACLADLPTKDKDDALEKDIDAFVMTLTQSTVPPAPKQPSGGTPPATPGGLEAPAAAPAAPSRSHLAAVLSADGLAQKLGVNPATGMLSASQHILLLKTLESGGSVSRYSNILRTKIRYSGGAVGTYALFATDGALECSGNVFDYTGSIAAKDFQTELRKQNPDPARQLILLRGSCRPPSQSQ